MNRTRRLYNFIHEREITDNEGHNSCISVIQSVTVVPLFYLIDTHAEINFLRLDFSY